MNKVTSVSSLTKYMYVLSYTRKKLQEMPSKKFVKMSYSSFFFLEKIPELYLKVGKRAMSSSGSPLFSLSMLSPSDCNCYHGQQQTFT